MLEKNDLQKRQIYTVDIQRHNKTNSWKMSAVTEIFYMLNELTWKDNNDAIRINNY